ncbi:MAG: hypothetical protein LBD03_04050 [Methanobrevibacter sp.]|nr:hypothetical protein [Candidatus Methanovirga procula]
MTFPIINGWVCGVTPTNEKIGALILNSHSVTGHYDYAWCYMDNKWAWDLDREGDKVVTHPDEQDGDWNKTCINYIESVVTYHPGSKLEDRTQLVNDTNGKGILGVVLNFRIFTYYGILKNWTSLQTDNNGYVNLSDLNFTFFPYYNQPFIIEYKIDGEKDYYSKYIFITKFDSQLSVNISDVVNGGDKLSGEVSLVNKSSGLGIAGVDLNVFIDGKSVGVLRTNDSGYVDLSNINYTFSNLGECNLTINYGGDDYYNSTGYLRSIRVNRFNSQLSVNDIVMLCMLVIS